MPTDPNMTGLIYPTEDGDEDIWDTIQNTTCWPVIGAHDHTTGKGVKIPSAALNINADVSWASGGMSYSITGLKAIDFTPVAASTITGYASALFVNSDDANNLYFRNQSGTNVKITDGSTLNVSIVGGIGGDYSSVSALLDYDDASDTYRFRQETSASVRQYAKVSMADLVIREYDPAGDASVPVETVTIKSPDALAASYALTLPASLPASTSVMQVASTGAISASNLLPDLDTVTLQSNKHVVLQGAGSLKHGTAKLILNGHFFTSAGSGSFGVASDGSFCAWILAVSTTMYIRIDGLSYTSGGAQARITAVRVHHSGPLTAGDNLTVSLSRVVSTTGVKTDEGSAASTTSPLNLTGLSRDTSGHTMYVKLVTTANSDYGIRYIEIDYEMV